LTDAAYRRPPIVCSTGGFWTFPLERSLDIISQAGFDTIELMVTHDPATQSAEVAGRLANNAGLRIQSVHAPMLVLTRRVWGPGFQSIIERSVPLAKSLGAEVVVLHPPYLFEVKYQTWLLGHLRSFSRDHGVAIAVENMFRMWVKGRPVRGHRWVTPFDLHRFDDLTLDTSHCGVDDVDILEALERTGRQIAHVHLSDNYGEHKDSHAPPGEGRLPLRQFLKNLPSSGARGALSLEIDMRALAQDPPKAVDTLKRAREFCEDAL
jgi:sugar phosphate isomerase/epimerase